MNFSDEEIKRQIRLGEDSHWEFKEIVFAGNVPKSPRRDDLADELAAFANTDGGVLFCGVTDSGDVQGMSREQMDQLEQFLTEVCTDKVKPPIRLSTTKIELDAGKHDWEGQHGGAFPEDESTEDTKIVAALVFHRAPYY